MNEEPFRVQLTATAQRCLHRLPEKIVGACLEFIAGPLAADPHRHGKPPQRELTGYHAARRGTYRVVYEIDDSTRTMIVARGDHQGDVYRSRRGQDQPDDGNPGCALFGSEADQGGTGVARPAQATHHCAVVPRTITAR